MSKILLFLLISFKKYLAPLFFQKKSSFLASVIFKIFVIENVFAEKKARLINVIINVTIEIFAIKKSTFAHCMMKKITDTCVM